jgi:hypothetical protein
VTEESLNQWLSSYTIPIQESKSRFNFAGNIPLVFTISFGFDNWK